MPQTTTYGYDAHGNIVKKTMPNGETITQTYDALNRVTKIEGQKPSVGGLLYRYGYRYDLAGNVVHIREDYSESPASWREIQQTYDRAHRLISEQFTYSPDGILGTDEGNRVISYRYDDADSRTQKAIFRFSEQEDYSYNTLNQLTHLGAEERSVDYEYDLNGNRIVRTEDTTVTGYAYDYDNRLVTVTNESLESVYTYTYDFRTRRVGIEATAESPAPGTTTLSFSGGTSVQEFSGSTLNVEYIRGSDLGGGIGGILYTIRGGDSSFTHYNSRGDVVAKTDNANTLTYQAAYEAYGTRSDEAGSTLDRQKANTKDEDPTGLLNEGFRYRDLEIGEFITRDPAGFVDGPNLYTYVRQNPWSKFDPKGLRIELPKPKPEGGTDDYQNKGYNEKLAGNTAKWNNAIALLRKTPEGRKLLAQLERSDVTVNVDFGKVKEGGITERQKSDVINITLDFDLMRAAETGIRPGDSARNRTIWHELYHAGELLGGAFQPNPSHLVYESHTGNYIDPLNLYTTSPKDLLSTNRLTGDQLQRTKLYNGLAHERRAVRFENRVANALPEEERTTYTVTEYGPRSIMSPDMKPVRPNPRWTPVPDPYGLVPPPVAPPPLQHRP